MRPRPLQAPNLPLPVNPKTRYDEKGHNEQWRNQLASDLNALLDFNSGFEQTPHALLCTILTARIADFEEIRPVKD